MKIKINEPILLSPVCKDIIWGGNRLAKEFGKGNGKFERIAETWELTVRDDAVSTVSGGELDGKPLSELEDTEDFPVLIKFIDAKENLSVQVHPGNEYAKKYEGDLGKTEMWYVVDALPGAQLVYGLRNGIDKEDFKKAVEENKIGECLNYVDVHRGDVFFIPAGCVHAIGGGILIAEIQQSSNVTYRVYDYDRGRELHVKKALDVIELRTKEEIEEIRYSCADEINGELLADCEIFRVEKKSSESCKKIEGNCDKFRHLLVISGKGRVGALEVCAGSSVLIPKGCERVELDGDFEFVLTVVK
ncbi:MAG: class I mannose-6-phosphate isomerase [Clostridia bacterium]|nr:class I mannose-6-phosphate isomerase [Clostridia bacterium]